MRNRRTHALGAHIFARLADAPDPLSGTPLGRVFALDPITGAERWSYDSKVPRDKGYGDFANRGVSTWKPATGGRRIYITTVDARLIALDAASGKPIAGFGDTGAGSTVGTTWGRQCQ